MTRVPIQLSESEQVVVAAERFSHPGLRVRCKMLVLWSVNTGLTRLQSGKGRGSGTGHRSSLPRRLPLGRPRWPAIVRYRRPRQQLAEHAEAIKTSLNDTPVRTIAEAADRIEQLTGLRRGLTQTRVFLKGLGFQWQRTRAVPVPPKSR